MPYLLHPSTYRRRGRAFVTLASVGASLAVICFFAFPALFAQPPYALDVPALPDGDPAVERTRRVAAFERAPELPDSFEEHTAESAVLIDLEHDAPLYERNADTRRAAASLTKLVTMYVILDELDRGGISLEDRVFPDPRADWREMPPGSSLMFLREGEAVTWHELLLGLSVASGNDAAYAAAYELSGSIDSFADRMNDAVAKAGVEQLHFTEPSGIAADNEIRAGAFAEFARHYVERFPEAVAEYHGRESVTIADENVEFRNRNQLVSDYVGADGLKTGYIPASGYNIVATAERDGRRLVSVLLGVEGDSHTEGGRRRESEAAELLDYGFDSFEYAELEPRNAPKVRVPGAGPVRTRVPPVRIIASSAGDELHAELNLASELRGPFEAGDTIGYVDVIRGDRRISWQPVYAAEDASVGNGIGGRAAHAAAWWRGVPVGGMD